MRVRVLEDTEGTVEDYATVPNRFQVRSVFDVIRGSSARDEVRLVERKLDVLFVKDYDAIEGEHPTQWKTRFDLSTWKFFVALDRGRRVGGAAVALKTAGLEALQDGAGIAALWDIRVAPEARGKGIGSALLRAAEAWARAKGCRELSVETQNINVPACRFYQRQRFVLVAANRFAYPAFPEEIQLLWRKALRNSKQ